MADHLQESLGYLKARLEDALKRPGLHRTLINVYKNYIKIGEEEPENYMRKAGDMFLLNKAEHLDRQANFFDLYKKFQFREKQVAHKKIYDSIKNAAGYADINSRITDSQKETGPLLLKEYEKREHLQKMIQSAISYKTALEKDKLQFKKSALESWIKLMELDPDITWEKIRAHPPYRNCLYYDNERLKLIETWMEEIKS